MRLAGDTVSQTWYGTLTCKNTTRLRYTTCKQFLSDAYSAPVMAFFCAFDLANLPVKRLSTSIMVTDMFQRQCTVKLAGIIYFNKTSSHFIANIFDKEGNIWYHNGISTESSCTLHGTLATMDMRSILTLSGVLKK